MSEIRPSSAARCARYHALCSGGSSQPCRLDLLRRRPLCGHRRHLANKLFRQVCAKMLAHLAQAAATSSAG